MLKIKQQNQVQIKKNQFQICPKMIKWKMSHKAKVKVQEKTKEIFEKIKIEKKSLKILLS